MNSQCEHSAKAQTLIQQLYCNLIFSTRYVTHESS